MKRPTNPKIGDKFRVATKYHIYFKKGQIVSLFEDDNSKNPKFIRKYKYGIRCHWADLEPLTKTLDNLEVGDVLVNEYENEQKILAVLPEAYLLSESNHLKSAYGWVTPHDLKRDGYTIKDQPQDDTTELSLQEVADKFGISVDKLRIKE